MAVHRVGTFLRHAQVRGPIKRSWIQAYTKWYSPGHGGCVEFDVEAENGTEAKKLAIEMRLKYELDKGAKQ